MKLEHQNTLYLFYFLKSQLQGDSLNWDIRLRDPLNERILYSKLFF